MTELQLPTVDVIIAVRNEERRIGSCLQSLLAQDYPAELINIFVVDNNSTDGTREVVGRYPVKLLFES
ncbi:MAG: glycosyltransferase, partial [Gemmatimonadaceae bacterium]